MYLSDPDIKKLATAFFGLNQHVGDLRDLIEETTQTADQLMDKNNEVLSQSNWILALITIGVVLYLLFSIFF